MKFSFLEKFGASLLICAWLIYGTHLIGDALVSVPEHAAVAAVHEDAEPAEEETAGEAGEGEAGEGEADFATLLASADAAAGEKVFSKCKSCHSVEQGGKNKVGPNLWSVVGRPKASADGFAYSDALGGLGGEWGYEDLAAFLASPKEYAPGNKMTFAGLKKIDARAAVIAYLRENGENPPPLPTPEPKAEESAEAAPAEEEEPKAEESAEAAPAEEEPKAEESAEAAPAEEAAKEEPKEEPKAEESAEAASTEEEPKETAAAPAEESAKDEPKEAEAAAGGGGLSALLAAADPAAGEKVFKKCKACHTTEQGGKNRVGPNLWNVVGGPKAHAEGFAYSDAVSGLGGEWTYEDLDAYLTKPTDFAPGTKMSFGGLKKPEDRASVISYLRTLSDSPKPLP
jgi:cytochrome c